MSMTVTCGCCLSDCRYSVVVDSFRGILHNASKTVLILLRCVLTQLITIDRQFVTIRYKMA
jgi:hypothetical protein